MTGFNCAGYACCEHCDHPLGVVHEDQCPQCPDPELSYPPATVVHVGDGDGGHAGEAR